MKFIHNRDKDGINILNANHQLILKIIGHPLLFCQQHSGWFLACGKETIQIDMNSHNNNEATIKQTAQNLIEYLNDKISVRYDNIYGGIENDEEYT